MTDLRHRLSQHFGEKKCISNIFIVQQIRLKRVEMTETSSIASQHNQLDPKYRASAGKTGKMGDYQNANQRLALSFL